MNKQPEALRLAELIDIDNPVFHFDMTCTRAAAELRRLHKTNQELLEALQVLADEASSFSVDGVYFNEKCMGHKGLDMAFDAIAKATGERL